MTAWARSSTRRISGCHSSSRRSSSSTRLVALAAGRDPELAFAYADRARTRVLPGSASAVWTQAEGGPLPAEPQPLPIDEIRRRLPEGVTLVQYSVLPEQVLIWVLRHDEKQPLFIPVAFSRGELEKNAAELRDFEKGKWEAAAETLFDRLVRPGSTGFPRRSGSSSFPTRS